MVMYPSETSHGRDKQVQSRASTLQPKLSSNENIKILDVIKAQPIMSKYRKTGWFCRMTGSELLAARNIVPTSTEHRAIAMRASPVVWTPLLR